MIGLLMALFFDNPAWRDRLADRKLGITIPDDLPDDDELRETYRTARSLDPEMMAYFESQDLSVAPSEIERGITEILNRFEVNILKNLQSDRRKGQLLSGKKAKNIFEFAGCEKLYLSNKYTRIISESLGHQFEEIAALSPRVLVPETSLGLNLKGIDAIVYVDAEIYYTQIKTKRDTLTGSQVSRSINELRIHPHSLFVAALDMGKSNNPSQTRAEAHGIEHRVGQAFWQEIGVDYQTMLEKICQVLQNIEHSLYSQV